MHVDEIIPDPLAFDWNEGNMQKSWLKHHVSIEESQEVFADENGVVFEDIDHSQYEARFVLLGCTAEKRALYIVFTIRGKQVRIISARPMNRKEVALYEEKARLTKIQE